MTIICTALKGTGNQYTKRILPPHLIPRSPFSSAVLIELLEENRGTENSLIEKVCMELNCIDARTAKKHLQFVRETIARKHAALARIIASSPNPAANYAFPPELNSLDILALLWNTVLALTKELSGTIASLSLEGVLWISPGFEGWKNFNRSCMLQTVPP